MIIGIAGRKRSGKDTVASLIVNEFGFVNYALSTPIKFMLQSIGFYEPDNKEEIIAPALPVSYRHLVQTLGTDWGRNLIDKGFWLFYLEALSIKVNKIVVSDVRFQNEVDWIIDRGGFVIELHRDTGLVDPHESELVELQNTIVIDNNGTYEELYNHVRSIVNQNLSAGHSD